MFLGRYEDILPWYGNKKCWCRNNQLQQWGWIETLEADAYISRNLTYERNGRCIKRASLVAQRLKCLPPMQETQVLSLGREDPLEKEMVTHSSILAWRIPWMEEPGGLQSMGLQRVRHNWATSLHFTSLHFRLCAQKSPTGKMTSDPGPKGSKWINLLDKENVPGRATRNCNDLEHECV